MIEQKIKIQTNYQPCLDFKSPHFNQYLAKSETRQKAYIDASNKSNLIVAGSLVNIASDVRYQVIVRHKKSGVCRMMRYCQSNSPDKIIATIKKRFSVIFDFDTEDALLSGKTLAEKVYYFTNQSPISYFNLDTLDGAGWEFVDARPVDEHGSNSEVKMFNNAFLARFVLDASPSSASRQMKTYSGIKLDLDHVQGYVFLDTVYEMSALIPS